MPVTSRIRVKSSTALGPITRAVEQLSKYKLLVGIPGDSQREPLPGQRGTPPTNALVGYAMEFGLPEKNVPARPFLLPGIESVKSEVANAMLKGVERAFTGDMTAAEKALQAAGLIAEVAVKQKLQNGPYAPLALGTIEARARRKYADTGKPVGAKSNRDARTYLELRAQGTPDEVLQSAGIAQPLVDTRSLLMSIQHVVVKKGG